MELIYTVIKQAGKLVPEAIFHLLVKHYSLTYTNIYTHYTQTHTEQLQADYGNIWFEVMEIDERKLVIL